MKVFLLALLLTAVPTAEGWKWKVLSSPQRLWHQLRSKQLYTPLVFFTGPPGLSPEVDAVEKAVRQVERELGVRVERMDLLRCPETEAVLKVLAPSGTAPLLYHRESLQVYTVPSSAPTSSAVQKNGDEGVGAAAAPKAVHVDYDRIRAWAKGRYLHMKSSSATALSGGKKVGAPPKKMLENNDNSSKNNSNREEDQALKEREEMLEDMTLSPLQRKGKQAMKERTAKLANSN